MASNRRIKGITIEIGGDTTKLDQALERTNKELNTTQSNLRDVERLLKIDPKNTELLAQKQKYLAEAVETATKRVETLKQAISQADEAIKRDADYKAAYEPLKEQLDKVNATIAGLKNNADSMKQQFETGKISTEQYDAFNQKLEESRQKSDELKAAIKALDEQFSGARFDQSQLEAMERELIDNTEELKNLTREAKNSETGLDRLADAAGRVSQKAGKIRDAFMPVTTAIAGIGAAAFATIPATDELRTDLSRLETNAQQAGVGVDAATAAFDKLRIMSGETDSSVEAVSNLLQAGFTESNLELAVEGLANAATAFPDTIKIESLADSLQETLATGEATGQFGELLDRLGIGAENFSAGLAMCTTEADKQYYALDALVNGPLKGTYDSWAANNDELLANRQSSVELQDAMARLAEEVMPVATTVANLAAGFLDWFTNLGDGAQIAIVSLGLLLAAVGPVAGIISSISGALPTLTKLLEGVNIKTLGLVAVVGILVGLFAAIVDAWDDMSGLEKVVSVLGLLTAAAFAAALAFGAFQSAFSMGVAVVGIVAGIAAVIAAITSAQSKAQQAANSMSSLSVPAFANGGVVPPNAPFLAVLGDNTKEPEVVAPYSTIKQAASDAIAERGGGSGMAVADIYLDGAKVGRGIFPYLENERVRVGARLVGGAGNGGIR